MAPWQDESAAAAADDNEDDFLSASSGSRSESPSPRTASLSSASGAFALSPRAGLFAAAACAASAAGDGYAEQPAPHQGSIPGKVAADSRNGSLNGDSNGSWVIDVVAPASAGSTFAASSESASMLHDAQPAATTACGGTDHIAAGTMQHESGSSVTPPQSDGEAVPPLPGLASLQAS